MTEIFHDFHEFFPTNSELVPQIKPPLFFQSSFQFTLSFNAVPFNFVTTSYRLDKVVSRFAFPVNQNEMWDGKANSD